MPLVNIAAMRIISERKLREFWQKVKGEERSRREIAMREWIAVVKKADWHTFSDIRQTFNHSDVYKNCTIFDVGGNQYRIIGKVAFRIKVVFIRFVLTHSEYDEDKWKGDC